MALQLGALRDALKAANVPDGLAREAAEEVAGYDNRLSGIERQIVDLRSYMEQRFAQVELRFGQMEQRLIELRAYVDQRLERVNGQVNLLTWMVGFVLALVVAMFVKQFVR